MYKMTTYELFIKVGNSPKSIEVLQYLSTNIKTIRNMARINMHAYTAAQLQDANLIRDLTEQGVTGLPAMIVAGDHVLHSNIDIINHFRAAVVPGGGRSKRAAPAGFTDTDELVERMQLQTLNNGQDDSALGDETIPEDAHKQKTLRSSDSVAGNRIANAISTMEQNGRPSVAAKLQKIKSRIGMRAGPSRDNPEAAGVSITSIKAIDDVDIPHGIPPPGKTSGSSLRNRIAANGGGARPGNLYNATEDEDGIDYDGIDKILHDISRNTSID